jgi:hypothetical protein
MFCISGLSQENNCCTLHPDLLTTIDLMGTGVKYGFSFSLRMCTSIIYVASRWKFCFWNPALHMVYGYMSIILQNNCLKNVHDGFFTMTVVLTHMSFQSFKAYAHYYTDFKDNYILKFHASELHLILIFYQQFSYILPQAVYSKHSLVSLMLSLLL